MMKLARRACLVLLLAAAAMPFGGPAQATIPAGVVPSLAPMLRAVTPAVVNIATRTTRTYENPLAADPFFRQFFNMPERFTQETRASGSGVIVDAAHGYVLTNNHVIAGADVIEVTTKDGRHFRAHLVGTDPETDVAVLKIPAEGLTQITFGNSDALQVGDFVVAIGNPFGIGQTVTSGIVSALRRSGLGIEGYENFIQTDASINPGNSGGALVDLEGRLVGINTAILAPNGANVGIGFAVPIDMARDVMRQLIATGHVVHGAIGVAVQDLTPRLAAALGVRAQAGAVVAAVAEGSPAARAGLQQGDVVVSINGAPIRNAAQFRNTVALSPIGRPLSLRIDRQGTPVATTVAVAAGRAQGG